MGLRRTPILLAILVAGCASDEAPQCELGVVSQSVLAEDRNILGAGGAYPADTTLRGRTDELYRSQSLRRETAWHTVSKVLAPVSLAQGLSNVEETSVPLWRSWYAKDDAQRLFQHLFEELSPEQQSARAHFEQGDIDAAFGWNVDALDTLPNWPEERKQAYLDAIDNKDKLAGIGGVSQVGYSPGALRHLLRSYPEVLGCALTGTPDDVTGAPVGDTTQEALREPVAITTCESQSYGPFFVAAEESLTAVLSGEGLEGATLVIHSGESETRCQADEGKCEVSGGGTYYLRIAAGEDELKGALQVDYQSPNTPWAACLESAFPSSSVIVKASWKRIQFGSKLPTYETSAEALDARFANNVAQGWDEADGEADPGGGEIYSIELANGNRYRLAALHIMTKELDHWQWITLWWSDAPDTDFGEDRPESIANLGGPWKNYKMCVATDFQEGDPDPMGGFAAASPSLAGALASVHGGVGSPSWCSNPYLEEGPGNVATNCIGCHQHGGTTHTAESIIGELDRFPEHGRTQLRNNFPHDYSWALSDGDRLASTFREIVSYFDDNE